MNAEQDKRVFTPRRKVHRSPTVGGSGAAAAAGPSDSVPRQQLSRLALKRLVCAEVCRIAEHFAGTDAAKLNALESLSDKGMCADTKVAVVNLLVNDWGYIHTDVSSAERSVATNQVRLLDGYLCR